MTQAMCYSYIQEVGEVQGSTAGSLIPKPLRKGRDPVGFRLTLLTQKLERHSVVRQKSRDLSPSDPPIAELPPHGIQLSFS